jgi:U4/U6 small nuclear ribonucleoprotein PRP31
VKISTEAPQQFVGVLEEQPLYKLILSSNKLVQEIDEEIIKCCTYTPNSAALTHTRSVHRFVMEIYAQKFPELDQLVPNKIDYVKTIQRYTARHPKTNTQNRC